MCPCPRSASIREARVEDCPSLRNLPENLRWHRRIRDLSQANLAALSGFAQQYISALERGLRPSDPCHVEALAQALGLSPKTLLRRPRKVRLIGRPLMRPVGGEFVGIRHRSIFGSREPGVPRDVVAMA